MRMLAAAPSPALAPFVGGLWYFEGPDLPHRLERALPTGRLQLLINLHADELGWYADPDAAGGMTRIPGAAIGGAYDAPIVIDTTHQRRIVGANLRPGAAAVVCGVGGDELAGTHTGMHDVWGQRGADVRAQLLGEATPEAVLARLDAALVAGLTRRWVDRRVQQAIAVLHRGRAVREAAEAARLSTKTLRRRFAVAVGLGPKRYARVARFQRVLQAIDGRPPSSWAAFAADHGYSDQAHLIQEFRGFAHVTPAAYRARAEGDWNHVVLDP